jgi:hypothetical protein
VPCLRLHDAAHAHILAHVDRPDVLRQSRKFRQVLEIANACRTLQRATTVSEVPSTEAWAETFSKQTSWARRLVASVETGSRTGLFVLAAFFEFADCFAAGFGCLFFGTPAFTVGGLGLGGVIVGGLSSGDSSAFCSLESLSSSTSAAGRFEPVAAVGGTVAARRFLLMLWAGGS